MHLVYEMEQNLYNDGVICLSGTFGTSTTESPAFANKSLIQLEATLLELAATPELCKGVMYVFPIAVQGKYIVRHV